jgi:hypothetical protein
MATKFNLPRAGKSKPAPATQQEPVAESPTIDLERRRDQLTAKVAELQWDLGGLVYEMAVRDRVRVDVIIKHAAELQNVDSELQEIERIIKAEHSHTAGTCTHCGAPHSSGAGFCWQCGAQIMRQVDTSAIFGS